MQCSLFGFVLESLFGFMDFSSLSFACFFFFFSFSLQSNKPLSEVQGSAGELWKGILLVNDRMWCSSDTSMIYVWELPGIAVQGTSYDAKGDSTEDKRTRTMLSEAAKSFEDIEKRKTKGSWLGMRRKVYSSTSR